MIAQRCCMRHVATSRNCKHLTHRSWSQVMRKLRFIPLAVFAISAVSCSEVTAPPPPDILELAGTAEIRGVVGSDHTLSIRLTDAAGRPIDNGAVRWNLGEGGGSVAPAVSMTDASGLAEATWTLSERPGTYRLLAESEWIVPLAFTATVVIGPPVETTAISKIPERVAAGAYITTSFAVRDRFGNPVPGTEVRFEVVEGDGSLEVEGVYITDLHGLVTLSNWRLGPTIGRNRLRAVIEGIEPLDLTIQGVPFNFSVTGLHLNQGTQRPDGSIEGVAGRAGLLRVILRGAEDNDFTPSPYVRLQSDVLVRLFDGDRLMREVMLSGTRHDIPAYPDLANLGDTWNIVLKAEEVGEDLRVEVIADPHGVIPDSDSSDNRWPRSRGSAPLGVRSLAPLRIIFIPVNTFTINKSTVEDLLTDTRKWIPAGQIEYSIRSPFISSADLRISGDWVRLLGEINAMRTAEGARDEYYHGIVPLVENIALGGIAYVPASPYHRHRSALSVPFSDVVAHELGHNLGRRHAPCGNPSGSDVAYPYANGRVGQVGYDISLNTLVSADAADYMSYCGPEWTSDYTYKRILDWRRIDPMAVRPGDGALKALTETEGLMIWGRIHSRGAELYPAFHLTTVPVLPPEPGPVTVRGLSPDGREVFRLSFEGTMLGHSSDHSERHFNFFVPLSAADIDAVWRIELVAPSGIAERATAIGAGKNDLPRVIMQSGARGIARVQWDSSSHPMIMVRDARTGHVLAFGRDGVAQVDSRGRSMSGYEVLISNGVKSMRTTVE
jgi:hypothetical protein